MDDFGSGYSDFSLLNVLPMDIMKLDRTLLNASEDSERMQVICEGIESHEQEELLLANGCIFGQGFCYARPLPEDEFQQFLAEHI